MKNNIDMDTKAYRERLQALIETLQACYDEAGILRDYCDGETMKGPLNNCRGKLYDTWGPLQRLDNSLLAGHAAMRTSGKGLCKD